MSCAGAQDVPPNLKWLPTLHADGPSLLLVPLPILHTAILSTFNLVVFQEHVGCLQAWLFPTAFLVLDSFAPHEMTFRLLRCSVGQSKNWTTVKLDSETLSLEQPC